jgi:hypothetical protein
MQCANGTACADMEMLAMRPSHIDRLVKLIGEGSCTFYQHSLSGKPCGTEVGVYITFRTGSSSNQMQIQVHTTDSS